MAMAPSRLSDFAVIKALRHNEALREAANPEPEDVPRDHVLGR